MRTPYCGRGAAFPSVAATVLIVLLLACAQRPGAAGPKWAMAWGGNDAGQLGIGAVAKFATPQRALVSDAVGIAAGGSSSFAIRRDGAVLAWGDNGHGQLGAPPSWDPRTIPAPVAGVDSVVAVACGSSHTLFLKSDGTVWSCGANWQGQLGDGTTTDRHTPAPVSGVSGVAAVAAGVDFSLALTSSGQVYAWGANWAGQLGDGTNTGSPVPVSVSGISNVVAIAAGPDFGVALTAGGTVYAWGFNSQGQLGDGTNSSRNTPAPVLHLSGITAIAAGGSHALALRFSGEVYAWGDGVLEPAAVEGLSGIQSIYSGRDHSFAAGLGGSPVMAWGLNGSGQLGIGTFEDTWSPAAVSIDAVSSMAGGASHTLALKSNGEVWAWGSDYSGQLGTGRDPYYTRPASVRELSDIASLGAGSHHSLAVKNNGTLYAWGANFAGQLGDDTVEDRAVPVPVATPAPVAMADGGHYHSLAVLTDGRVCAWGANWWGQLGDGTYESRLTPTVVPGITNAVAIAAGGWHSLALLADGSVRAWGEGWMGQLGDGANETSPTPVAVSGLSNVVAIAAGQTHSLAVRSDGTVWAWGENSFGQIGDGTTEARSTPVQVPGLSNIVAVAGGGNFSLALTSSGMVYAWGANDRGQLGDGTTINRASPVIVSGLPPVVALAAGITHVLAVGSDSSLYAWGANDRGQLGDGTLEDRHTPILVGTLNAISGAAAGSSHSLALTDYMPTYLTVERRTGYAGEPVTLSALLKTVDENPLWDKEVAFFIDGTAVGTARTGTDGVASLNTTVPAGLPPGFYACDAEYAGQAGLLGCQGREWLQVLRRLQATTAWTMDRTGTITEIVTLRGYLRRVSDNAWLDGKTVEFRIDGTVVGSAVTGATGTSGRADLNWVIAEGPASRTIRVEFPGDLDYQGSSGMATLTCQSWGTKMATFDRTARITDRTELKCRFLRSDNTPLYNKTINFYVDGTFVIARPTNVQGYASYPFYDVPDGAGAGVRTILSEWPGNGGYAAISRTANLTVLKAIPYIWVMPRSVKQGQAARLYAYFRRLYDYAKQEGKTVTWRIDGTWIGESVTGTTESDEPGVARFNYDTSGLSLGTHTVRCEWAGDAWVDAGYGEGNLTIY